MLIHTLLLLLVCNSYSQTAKSTKLDEAQEINNNTKSKAFSITEIRNIIKLSTTKLLIGNRSIDVEEPVVFYGETKNEEEDYELLKKLFANAEKLTKKTINRITYYTISPSSYYVYTIDNKDRFFFR